MELNLNDSGLIGVADGYILIVIMATRASLRLCLVNPDGLYNGVIQKTKILELVRALFPLRYFSFFI